MARDEVEKLMDELKKIEGRLSNHIEQMSERHLIDDDRWEQTSKHIKVMEPAAEVLILFRILRNFFSWIGLSFIAGIGFIVWIIKQI